ncbi:hypothetical protein B0T20DRAFT_165344 [Sordaria brevicollis]|uniref:Uncharacterized protein n=1 Tax=Sordaria brevicollis TaxID=83679 RepID=A0AAE0UCZ4_SORBR|nr:hypothetical protein B0T20DRAFT_165344 [Sordaria brevicollis]
MQWRWRSWGGWRGVRGRRKVGVVAYASIPLPTIAPAILSLSPRIACVIFYGPFNPFDPQIQWATSISPSSMSSMSSISSIPILAHILAHIPILAPKPDSQTATTEPPTNKNFKSHHHPSLKPLNHYFASHLRPSRISVVIGYITNISHRTRTRC